MSRERAEDRHARFTRALGDERLPAALVDLDALEANIDTLAAIARGGGKTLRVASKSVRAPEILRRIFARGGDCMRGVMTYTAEETAFLAENGFDDVLLAYPTLHRRDLSHLVAAVRSGATVRVVVDATEQLDALEAAATAADTPLRVIVDVDVSYRPLGARVHLGVRRSPLRSAKDVLELVARIATRKHLTFDGVMAYEAQIAGVTDENSGGGLRDVATRAMKSASRTDVATTRAEIDHALRTSGHAFSLFNGGGTGSLASSVLEGALTEVTAGSGFLDSHLFDRYQGLVLEPAACFALQIVRRPAPGMVTCHGGGFIASGAIGPDRLPMPWLPGGATLLAMEGAGEVQTPLRLPDDIHLELGAPVYFRHAKAGELAEHFTEYLLIRGDRIEARAPTYRGLGRCFLG